MKNSFDAANDRRVIIIGSGPAGAMAAHELVRAGISTVMLESGTELPKGILLRLNGRNLFRRMPELDRDLTVVDKGNQDAGFYTHYALGGMTNQWTGAVPRFCPRDFTEGERLHEKYVWPVTYDELEPYYGIAEREMRITANPKDVPNLPAGNFEFKNELPRDWSAVEECAARYGQGFTTMPLADGPPNLLVGRGTAFNSYSFLAEKLLGNPKFQLITGAHALRVEWDGAAKRAASVVYRDRHSGEDTRLAAAAFVLGCGAVNSAKLLLNSTSPDFPEGLGNSSGLLGRYLHDHPCEWWAFDLDRPATLHSPPAYLTRMAHDKSPPLMATSWTLGVVGKQDTIRSRLGMRGTAVGVQLFGTMVPSGSHYVALSPDRTDAFGSPALDIKINFDRDVIQNVVDAREHLMNLMSEAGFNPTMREVVPQLFPGRAKHYGGTTRMHASSRFGVTDAFNRLHDVKNVLVVDAGCFTTAAEKNPTLTIMAIAARAASKLAKSLRAGRASGAAHARGVRQFAS
ncbi:MAG: GMC oxidoreductase [Hyphomicrobiaceae bacterium]